jgi:ABC-type enterochelin transport system permease subunit
MVGNTLTFHVSLAVLIVFPSLLCSPLSPQLAFPSHLSLSTFLSGFHGDVVFVVLLLRRKRRVHVRPGEQEG